MKVEGAMGAVSEDGAGEGETADGADRRGEDMVWERRTEVMGEREKARTRKVGELDSSALGQNQASSLSLSRFRLLLATIGAPYLLKLFLVV